MNEKLVQLINELQYKFDTIESERKVTLGEIAEYIKIKLQRGEEVKLVFICTHNSRRSHISQFWAQAASYYYGINSINTYSSGTEATAFNHRAVKSMQEAGFEIYNEGNASNQVYKVNFGNNYPVVRAFSKKLDDPSLPKSNFAAIMVCSQANEACPVVFGAENRFALPYDDPKEYDDTEQESEMYSLRLRQIGLEMLYIFSKI